MFKYGKTAQNAIAAMSFLAEAHHEGSSLISSIEISEARGISKALTAKILTILSQAKLIKGSPGPHGGYSLARPPSEISLMDIVSLFEKPEQVMCPFGPNWCGKEDPCPLHHEVVRLNDQMMAFLNDTKLAVFSA